MRILPKLLLAYALPALCLFALFAWYAWEIARGDLDHALGRRLAAVAGSAGTQVRGRYLIDAEPEPDGGPPRAYLNTLRRLEAIRAATGVHRLAVFRLDDGAALCDTDTRTRMGEKLHEIEIDRHELGRVARGETVATVLFRGSDGLLYKAAYAPIHASDDDRSVVAALRVEAPASFFRDLEALRGRLVGAGAALAALVVLVSVVVASLITRPLRRLAGAAVRLGRGEWTAPLPAAGTDEIGALARAFAEMRDGLRARDERLQMMLAGIAHEVRNPLGGLTLFAGILRDELAADPEKLAHVARIDRELGHLSAIVSDFLEYARRPALELADVDLAGLAGEVVELMRGEAGEVTVELEATPAVRRADARQLKRALTNLVKNAVQASPAGGRVRVAVDGGTITVSDEGPGISADDSARIFTPFFTTKEKGTGLGLAFVKEIVAAHGGTIDVDSAAGRGTCFTVRLP